MDPLLGQVVDGYLFLRELGRGGMGVVYEVQHQDIGQRAALKTLLPERMRDAIDRDRFLREAKACAAINHPGLVRFFGFGQLPDGRPYFLMELLAGVSLEVRRARCPAGRLPVLSALRIVEQLASALAVVHANGLVHRDVSGTNVRIVPDQSVEGTERAVLLDFGIAKFLTDEAPALTGAPIYNPAYVAPERLLAGTQVTARSDVYSLGCLFFELVCGRLPFEPRPGEPWATVVIQQIHNSRPRPSSLVPELPPALDRMILSMLDRRPTHRPTMSRVCKDVQRLLAHPQQLQTRTSWSRRIGQTSVAWFAASAVGITALIAGTIFLGQRSLRDPHSWINRRILDRLGMIAIPGGTFQMGSTKEEQQIARDWLQRLGYSFPDEKDPSLDRFDYEVPARTVSVSPFLLDRREVTNAEFAEYLEQLRQTRAVHVVAAKGIADNQAEAIYQAERRLYNLRADVNYGGIEYRNGRFEPRMGMAQRPATALSFYAADGYCRWRNKRLPTEAEWEFAATNGGRTRFPWGDNEPHCRQSVLERGRKYKRCADQSPAIPDAGTTALDRTALGVLDLGGSFSEWTADSFRESYPPCIAECRDPRVEGDGTGREERGFRAVRGGAWSMDFALARAKGRFPIAENGTYAFISFRCARDP